MPVNKLLIVVLITVTNSLWAEIVINELYYDHEGTDTGYEWVELYNNGHDAQDLYGWQLQKAGGSFETVYIFDSRQLGSGEFLVVGESEVSQADIHCELAFQNGGSATDGVRICSLDSLYTDTILYDEPNLNQLPDDWGECGSSFAEDVNPGFSLIRYPQGCDTNTNSDWQSSHHPTPGVENIISIDLTIEDAQILSVDGEIELYTTIRNLSTQSVDNSVGNLDIYLDNEPFMSINLDGIGASQFMEYTIGTGIITSGYHQIKLELISIYDNDLENNNTGCSALFGLSGVILNELMVKPLSGICEWLEIKVSGGVDNFVDNLRIVDAAGTEGQFSSHNLLSGYQVISEDIFLLEDVYNLNEEQLICIDNLPGLNNTGDTVFLMDKWGTILDSVEYTCEAGEYPGISWERCNPYDGSSCWGLCEHELGHTAAAENSILSALIDVELLFKSIQEEEDLLRHTLGVRNLGINAAETGELSISWREAEEGISETVEEILEITDDSLEVVVYTAKPEPGYYHYEYNLYVEDDEATANNFTETSYNQNSLSWVINEIMYRPESGGAEWLEIKRNFSSEEEKVLQVAVNGDSIAFTASSEYTVITGSEADREYLYQQYGEELSISTGLKRLTDSGAHLKLSDLSGNVFESFSYDPAWNDNLPDVSIERINFNLPASAQNFCRCVQGNTIGRENSVYTPVPVTADKLSVSPLVINPAKGEQAVITYESVDNLNLVKIEIYDLKGRLINRLANQQYQSSEGIYFWDGRNTGGGLVSQGVYIVLFESSASGNSRIEKKTIVVKR